MKKAFYILLSINIVIGSLFVIKKYTNFYGAGAPPISYYDQWNVMRRSVYSIMSIDSNDIVFVGNSHTECFPVTEIFGDHVKNRGIGGNQTEHILQRLNEIVSKHPKKIFIEAGVNDIVIGGSPQKAFENYKQIITAIKQATPGTKIYVQSIFPVSLNYTKDNQAIIDLNNRLVEYCNYNGVEFIDIYPKMVNSGKLDSTLTADGLHLNGKGYDIWAKAIEKYVR